MQFQLNNDFTDVHLRFKDNYTHWYIFMFTKSGKITLHVGVPSSLGFKTTSTNKIVIDEEDGEQINV